MTDYIDKKALIAALDTHEAKADLVKAPFAAGSIRCLKDRVMRGEFDAKPELTKIEEFRSKTYNVAEPDGKFVYLLDITDFLMSTNNETVKKVTSLEQRVERLEQLPHERHCMKDKNHLCRHIPQPLGCDWDGKRCRCSL